MRGLKYILTLFMLLWSYSAFGATYYVSPSGSNTSPYDTWAKAANDPATVVAAGASVAGPHTVYIAPGTYLATSIILTDADWASSFWYGTAAQGSTSPAAEGQVIIDGETSGTYGLQIGVAGVTCKYFTIQNTDDTKTAIYITGANATLEGIVGKDSGYHILYISAAAGFNVSKSKFIGTDGTNASGIRVDGGAGGTISYSILSNSNDNACSTGTGNPIIIGACDVVSLNNMLIFPQINSTIYKLGAGTLNIQNSLVMAPTETGKSCVYQSSGTVNTNNNLFLISVLRTDDKYFVGTVGDTNNLKGGKTSFKQRPRQGFIVPCIDDIANVDEAGYLEDALTARGQKGTFFVNTALYSGYKTRVEAMYARGVMEIGCHSYSHTSVALTGNVLAGGITTPGGETITIDRAGDQIVLSGELLTISPFKSISLATIKTALEGVGCTVPAYVTNLNENSFGEILDDSGGAQASGYNPQFLIDTSGASGLFKTEIFDSKSYLEAQMGVSIYSYGGPYGSASSDSRTAVLNAGFESNRDNVSATGSSWLLGNIDTYAVAYVGLSDLIGASDEETVSRTRAICEYIANIGGIFAVIAHTGYTESDWAVVLDVIQDEYPEISVTSMHDAINAIKTSGTWSTVDSRNYTRSWVDASDYTLNADSDMIDTGYNWSQTGDFIGTTMFGSAWDIGVYEWIKMGGKIFIFE